MANSNRLMRVAIAPSQLMSALKTGWRVVADGLPADADYRSAWFDKKCQMFWVICESASFDEVLEGAMIPQVRPPVIRVRKSAENWHSAALIADSVTIKVYLDGELVASESKGAKA